MTRWSNVDLLQAFPLAAFMPVVKAAARQPVDNCKLAAAPSLGGPALTEAHSPSEDPQSNQVPEEPQQAAGCADASTTEHHQLQAASEAIQQPDQIHSTSAHCRPCHLALPDFSADTAPDPACVAPSSNIASIQTTVVSVQHALHLTVGELNRHCEAPREVNGQHAQTPGSLLPGLMEMHQATRDQTEEPKLSVGQTTAQTLQAFGNAHTGNVQAGHVTRQRATIIHDEQETQAAAGTSLLDDALPAGEAHAVESSGGARLGRAPEVGAMRKRRPFSWRKHGRSWQYLSLK